MKDIVLRCAQFGAPLGLLLMLGGALATRFDFVGYRLGLLVAGVGGLVAVLALVLALVGFLLTVFGPNRHGMGGAIFSMAMAAVPAFMLLNGVYLGATNPPIHDASTDLDNPPAFPALVVSKRGDESNSLDLKEKIVPSGIGGDYAGLSVVEVLRREHSDIVPVEADVSYDVAFRAALDTARDMGWIIQSADEEAARIAATDQTFWFGFADDIAIRITRPEGGPARIDARSVSRVGESDLGANAKRLRAYLRKLRKSLDLPPQDEELRGRE